MFGQLARWLGGGLCTGSRLISRRIPEPGQHTTRHPRDIRTPSGISGQDTLLGVYPIEQGHPSRQRQQHGADVPFLKVVADIANHVRQVDRMTHESVWACRDQTPQGGTYPKRSPQCEGDWRRSERPRSSPGQALPLATPLRQAAAAEARPGHMDTRRRRRPRRWWAASNLAPPAGAARTR